MISNIGFKNEWTRIRMKLYSFLYSVNILHFLKKYELSNSNNSGNYACDLPITRIAYSAVVYLRNNLTKMWYDTYNMINGQCKNIISRKYYRDNDHIITDCLLDLTLMPLPSLQIMYPQLRWFNFVHASLDEISVSPIFRC